MSFEDPPKFEKPPETKIEKAKKGEEELKLHLYNLLYPSNQRNDLYEMVRGQVYKGEIDEKKQERSIKEIGYDPEYLKEEGKKIHESRDHVRIIPSGQPSPERGRKIRDYAAIDGLCSSTVQEEGKTKIVEHSPLTTGLMSEVSRQTRKLLTAGIEKDPKKQEEIMGQPDAEVWGNKELTSFVEGRNKRAPEVAGSLDGLIKKIGDKPKRSQYEFVRNSLFQESWLKKEK